MVVTRNGFRYTQRNKSNAFMIPLRLGGIITRNWPKYKAVTAIDIKLKRSNAYNFILLLSAK